MNLTFNLCLGIIDIPKHAIEPQSRKCATKRLINLFKTLDLIMAHKLEPHAT